MRFGAASFLTVFVSMAVIGFARSQVAFSVAMTVTEISVVK